MSESLVLPAPAATASQWLAVLRGRFRLMALLFLAMVVAVMAASLLRAPHYTAQASLVFDPRPDPLSAPGAAALALSSHLATQVEVARNPRVARRALASLTPAMQARLRASWQADGDDGIDFSAWALALAARKLDVKAAREGQIMLISFTAPEPGEAAELANAFVRAYLDTSLELRVEPAREYAGFFETRGRAARAALEAAQSRLSAYQQANGIVATEERLDVENARLAELSTEFTALQAASSEAGSRQAQAQGRQADRLQEVLANPAVNQARADIGRAQAELSQVSTRLGDQHPQVQALREQLGELQQRLEVETRRVAGGLDVALRINRQREAETGASLRSQRDKVLRMKAVRDEGLLLVREVEQARRAYDAVQQRLSQSSLESHSTQGQASVLALAEPPQEPSSPRLLLNGALALVLGLLLALGTALLLELRGRRVRCADDVTLALGLPLLVAMPRQSLKGD